VDAPQTRKRAERRLANQRPHDLVNWQLAVSVLRGPTLSDKHLMEHHAPTVGGDRKRPLSRHIQRAHSGSRPAIDGLEDIEPLRAGLRCCTSWPLPSPGNPLAASSPLPALQTGAGPAARVSPLREHPGHYSATETV